jgi:uncharacterized protein YndB with AHSA1/START domain
MPDDAPLPFLTMTRRLKAAPAAVFAAWTDPGKLKRWWGPTTFTCPFAELDVRPGGAWRTCMVSPEGEEHWVGGVYETVDPPSRLSFTWAWDQADGSRGHESLVEIEFADLGGGATELRFRHSRFQDGAARDSHNMGWTSSLDDLASFLEGDQ